MPRSALYLLVGACVFALGGCGSGSTLTLRGCTIAGVPAKCGEMSVPENPSDPGGKHISLNVAVVKAWGAHPKPDPLFWFAGWGGAGVTDDAGNVISAFTELNATRDVVFIDQRGTGSSELRCAMPPAQQLLAADTAAITAAARRCVARIGPNLRYYTSAVAVDDVDAVRQALGYDRINIYGGSYGVTTGLIYLLRHGPHVRSAVFDSGSLLDVRIFENGARNAQRALDLLFARCRADAPCHTAFPHLEAEFQSVLARVARRPISIPGADAELTPLTFSTIIGDAIAYTPGKTIAPRLIHLVATGRFDEAATLVPKSEDTQSELAYMLLIQCSEPWASWRPNEVRRLAAGTAFYERALFNARLVGAACKGFPKASVPASIGKRFASKVPILFLVGNEDGADPPSAVANAQRELPNSRTVVFPFAGHGQLSFLCTQGMIARFVARGSAKGIDASCAENAAVLAFDTSS